MLIADELSLMPTVGLDIPALDTVRKMHITCVTIGTRGDVQPYIALCKGFMEDGHTCRIATHEEYRDWVTSFGIEFEVVEGNPADLMQLCVDHGMFSYGFLKAGISQFRGWIDELLRSIYTACQVFNALSIGHGPYHRESYGYGWDSCC